MRTRTRPRSAPRASSDRIGDAASEARVGHDRVRHGGIANIGRARAVELIPTRRVPGGNGVFVDVGRRVHGGVLDRCRQRERRSTTSEKDERHARSPGKDRKSPHRTMLSQGPRNADRVTIPARRPVRPCRTVPLDALARWTSFAPLLPRGVGVARRPIGSRRPAGARRARSAWRRPFASPALRETPGEGILGGIRGRGHRRIVGQRKAPVCVTELLRLDLPHAAILPSWSRSRSFTRSPGT